MKYYRLLFHRHRDVLLTTEFHISPGLAFWRCAWCGRTRYKFIRAWQHT